MARDKYQGVTEQKKAGRHRVDDARVLLDASRWRGAMYLAGYAVECLLKAKLMQGYDCRTLAELEDELQRRRLLPLNATIFTHQLEVLLRLTGATDRLRLTQSLWQAFNLVNQWVPAWRYNADLSTRDKASDFFAAVDTILHWIENNV